MSVRSPRIVPAAIAGVLVYLSVPFLTALFVLPGLAWFALIGLAVPAAIQEPLGVRDALRRGLVLGRADYAHALGALCTLTILVFVTQIAAAILLQGFADNSERAASFLAGLVLRRCSSSAGRSSSSISQPASGRPGRTPGSTAAPSTTQRSRLRRANRPEEDTVALYLMLTTLTEKGIQTLNSNPGRFAR